MHRRVGKGLAMNKAKKTSLADYLVEDHISLRAKLLGLTCCMIALVAFSFLYSNSKRDSNDAGLPVAQKNGDSTVHQMSWHEGEIEEVDSSPNTSVPQIKNNDIAHLNGISIVNAEDSAIDHAELFNYKQLQIEVRQMQNGQ